MKILRIFAACLYSTVKLCRLIAWPSQVMKRQTKTWSFLLSLAIFLLTMVALFRPSMMAHAEIPAGYTEYYIPISTDQAFQIFQDIDNNPELGDAFGVGSCSTGANECNEMHSIISIALTTDNATVYYDHWEDGYGSGSSGIDETYTGNSGDVLIFGSADIIVPRVAGNTCTSTNPVGASTACYDGRDRIYVVGGATTTTYAVYPEGNNIDTVFALAWEIYPVKPYLTSYTIPVGEDLVVSQGYNDFNQTFVTVQATSDATNIQIDDPATGASPDVNVTLNEGEVTELFHFAAGTTVVADNPVQVQFVVGQPHNGGTSEARGYTAVPSGLWDTAYYNPVSSFSPTYLTEIYIFNPTASPLNITYEDSIGSGNFNIPANSTRSFSSLVGYSLPVDSGLYLEATDGSTKFWAIGSGGTANSTGSSNAIYDYGFSLVPANLLKDDYYISWAPGSNDLSANGSPIWVTPTEDNTTVYVDYSPIDGIVDATYLLDRIEIQKLFDGNDNDNTGMHIWASSPIAVVWGQDGATASAGNPYMDVGYTSLPLPEAWMDVALTVDKMANPEVISDGIGQTTTFTLEVSSDLFPIDNVTVVDTLPADWAYVAGSTTITLPDNSTITGAAADPDISSQDLTWDDFPVGALDMNAAETLTIEFEATTTAIISAGYSTNETVASGTRNSGSETFTATDSATVYISDLEVSKSSSISGNVSPGDTIDYTMVITNSGSIFQNNIVVSDTLPAGTTYVAASTVVTAPVATLVGTVGDAFNARTFTGNQDSNGGATDPSWVGDWQEVGEAGGATSRDIQVLADISNYQLRLKDNDNDGEGVKRIMDISSCDSATLSFDYRRVGLDENTDEVVLRIGMNSTLTTDIGVFEGPTNDATYQPFSADITNWIDDDTIIRLLTSSTMGGSDIVYFDNVLVECYTSSIATNPGNAPTTLVAAIDNYDLAPGGVMTVTFQVTVDNPIAGGISSIDNTVGITSDEEPKPIQDSVSNPLGGTGTVSGHLYIDTNGNSTQDVGEPDLENVDVIITDTLGITQTVTTDANGDWTATVPPGSTTADVDETNAQ